ncbi:MAG: hypothetical protein GX297_05950 [Treponema sp.]|nr:hypothetical protein [Treponema sp.]
MLRSALICSEILNIIYSDIQQDSSNDDDENKENIEKSLDKVFLHI